MSTARMLRSAPAIGGALTATLLLLAVSAAIPTAASAADVQPGLQRVQAVEQPTPGGVARDVEATARQGGSLVLGILLLLLTGLVIGALAKLFMPGPDGGGIVSTSLLGVAGALLGGLIASVTGIGALHGFTLGSLALAVLGAMALLFLQRRLRHA